MIISYDKVGDFWKWFSSISNELLRMPDNIDLINQLDNFICSMRKGLDWEIGPINLEAETLNDVEYYLAISPRLDEELLALTHEIVDQAPDCPGWVFLAAKPAKGWLGNWDMLNELESVISIDANAWKYMLYQFEDKTFDMDIWVNNVNGNSDTKHIAVDIVITNLLGEEHFMKTIKHIKILSDEDANILEKWTLLKHLGNHLNSMQE